jgi:hypothetical protein
MPPRLLCLGKEQDSLQTRCAVLSHSGYDTKSATVAEGELLLRTEKFDLIIVSAFLSNEEKDCVILAAGDTPALVLEGFTFAEELLAQVARILPAPDPSTHPLQAFPAILRLSQAP